MFSFFELAFCPSFNFLFGSSSSAPLASLASSNASSSVRFFEDFFSSPSCLLSWSLPFLLSLVPFLSPSPLPSELNKYFFVGRGFFAFTDSNNQSRLTFSHVLTSQAVLSIHVSIQLSNDICIISKKNTHLALFFSTSFCVVTKCVHSDETLELNVAPWFSTRALRSAVHTTNYIISFIFAFISSRVCEKNTLFISRERPANSDVHLLEGFGGHNC